MRLLMVALSLMISGIFSSQADKYYAERNSMVKKQIIDRGISNPDVLKAMRTVPRHLFVPSEHIKEAYGDFPLPIGYGQTISQPFIVAYMTEAAKPTEKKKALEIGTGSGYQAAVLAGIVDSVYTIELIPELAKEAAERFKKLGYRNIVAKAGDGYNGWPGHAPFDIILVTAAPEKIPQPLIDQLAENGRMVVPVGEAGEVQELLLLVRKKGKIETSRLTSVRFVPFLRSKE